MRSDAPSSRTGRYILKFSSFLCSLTSFSSPCGEERRFCTIPNFRSFLLQNMAGHFSTHHSTPNTHIRICSLAQAIRRRRLPAMNRMLCCYISFSSLTFHHFRFFSFSNSQISIFPHFHISTFSHPGRQTC